MLSLVPDSQVSVEAITMLEVYKNRLAGELARIEKLEMLDEWEEFNLLQSHYCLCLGTRSTQKHDLTNIKI